MIKALIGNMTDDYAFLVFTYHGKVVLSDGGWPYRLFVSHTRSKYYYYGIHGTKYLTSGDSSDEEIEKEIQKLFNLGLTLTFVENWGENTIRMNEISS